MSRSCLPPSTGTGCGGGGAADVNPESIETLGAMGIAGAAGSESVEGDWW